MTNEELDELQKVRSIVEWTRGIDADTCAIEKVYEQETIVTNFLKNAFRKFFIWPTDEERREKLLEEYRNLPDTKQILINLKDDKYNGCKMYSKNSTLENRADWIVGNLINNGNAWVDSLNHRCRQYFFDISICRQTLKDMNPRLLTNAKFQHLLWVVKNLDYEFYKRSSEDYKKKFKQVYELELEDVREAETKLTTINSRARKLDKEEELKLAKLDRKNAHSVLDPFHVTHYHRDKRQGYRARRKRY